MINEKDLEASILPYCISELEKFSKNLGEYTPSNPELAELDMRDVVFRLSMAIQVQNHFLMTALRHLHEKDKTS